MANRHGPFLLDSVENHISICNLFDVKACFTCSFAFFLDVCLTVAIDTRVNLYK
jgi:hypothetical protein